MTLFQRSPNKSDASGGSACRTLLGAMRGALIRAARQLNRWVASREFMVIIRFEIRETK
jgi:hypothetical protein